jgi:putative ABC transport system substrate-binding protein
MLTKISFGLLITFLLITFDSATAQQSKIYRVGVLVPGEIWFEIVDGLRSGLKQLGLEEGKQYSLTIRDWKNDAKMAEAAAKNLETQKVDLIYATSTGSAIAARRATANIPIVFCAGTDPVVVGLVDSFANPGGRLTGAYSRVTDLTGKRLELLKEIVPKLRRVVTFYNPSTAVAIESSRLAREAAQRSGFQLIERHATSDQAFIESVRALKAGEVDAYLAVSDPLAANHARLIIDTAKDKRLPTMFDFQSLVFMGGLSSYSVSFQEVGRVSAKYVQRILTGVKPQDLPVEGVDKIDFVVNLKAAMQIGLTIPPNVLTRADKVIR